MFRTYQGWRTQLQTPQGAVNVHGIGSIKIPVKLAPNNRSGFKNRRRKRHGTLSLPVVLHAPDSICNIIGDRDPTDPRAYLLDVTLNTESEKISAEVWEGDKRVCYFTDITGLGLHALRLSGPPVGHLVRPSAFQKNTPYAMGAEWDPEERDYWEDRNGDSGHRWFTKKQQCFVDDLWGTLEKFMRFIDLDIYEPENYRVARLVLERIMPLRGTEHFRHVAAAMGDKRRFLELLGPELREEIGRRKVEKKR
ncbi:hypothetical protein OQA88_9544 [Cercophora sp. LCS_1]